MKFVCVTRTKSKFLENIKVFDSCCHAVVIALILTVCQELTCSDDRKYQKSVEQLQSAVDKMHKKGLTVEQYLSSVLATVCIIFIFCAFVAEEGNAVMGLVGSSCQIL